MRFFKTYNIEEEAKTESVEMIEEEYQYIEKIKYYPDSKRLILVVKLFTKKPKVTRYVQRNYVKYPIYGDYSEKTKVIKNIDRSVNINKFLEDLPFLELDDEINIEICEKLNITPSWYQKMKDIQKKEVKKDQYKNNINHLNNDINFAKNKIDNIRKECKDKAKEYQHSLNLDTTPNSKFMLFLGIILVPILIGIFILMAYTSVDTAENNLELQKRLKIESEELEINSIDKINSIELEIQNMEKDIKVEEKKITEIEEDIKEIENKDYKFINYEDENNFMDLKKSLNHSFDEKIKGCYVIWNKTKDKYYVGQSKDIFKRIFSQHFNKGDVKNIIFARDWYNNDLFLWRYIECETKDELDSLEQSLIEEYDAFRNGYNSTGGNS
ncbi:MAG: GIY-YIG nuclease family protein [Mycoplasmoidaceae bacterium]